MRMKAAETSASSAMADWTPLTVVSRSRTTAEIETFISDVSTTSTNMAIESRSASRRFIRTSPAGLPFAVMRSPSWARPDDGPSSDARRSRGPGDHP